MNGPARSPVSRAVTAGFGYDRSSSRYGDDSTNPKRGAVYDAIVKRYGIQGKLFTFVSKLRGGATSEAVEATAAILDESQTGRRLRRDRQALRHPGQAVHLRQ